MSDSEWSVEVVIFIMIMSKCEVASYFPHFWRQLLSDCQKWAKSDRPMKHVNYANVEILPNHSFCVLRVIIHLVSPFLKRNQIAWHYKLLTHKFLEICPSKYFHIFTLQALRLTPHIIFDIPTHAWDSQKQIKQEAQGLYAELFSFVCVF